MELFDSRELGAQPEKYGHEARQVAEGHDG